MSKRLLIATVIALAVLTPTAVMAATGSFSSSSSTTALSVANTGSGKAVNATSNTGTTGMFTGNATFGPRIALYGLQRSASNTARGVYGYASSSGSGQTFGVYGRTDASGDDAAGVYGLANNANGFVDGVLGLSKSDAGTGVYGVGALAGVAGAGPQVGVLGSSGTAGDGSYGVWSLNDAAVSGHLVGSGGDLAGTCDVLAQATSSSGCDFPDAFPAAPIVVLTPTSNPGAAYWVTTTTTGLTVHLASAPSGTVTFNYMVVGIDGTIQQASASTQQAATAGHIQWAKRFNAR
jgi:hypothetical protein